MGHQQVEAKAAQSKAAVGALVGGRRRGRRRRKGGSGSGISRRRRAWMSSAGLIPAERTRARQGGGSTGVWDAKECFPAVR
jgi:hypothetical protein